MHESTTAYKRNQTVLSEIERNVPQHLIDGLMKKVWNTEQEDTARMLLSKNDLSPALRTQIETDLQTGKFRYEEEIVNDEITKELDAYYDKEVKAAIADGRLSSPDEDPFYQKMAQKWDAQQLKNNEHIS